MTEKAPSPKPVLSWSDSTWAFMLLRLFLGFRALVAGIEKFEADGRYSMANYYVNMRRMGEGIASSSFLPTWLTLPYAYTLGHLLVLLGVLLLLGVKTRLILIITGLTYLSLAVGLMAVEEDGGVAWLAIHVMICAGALLLVPHNRLALTRN
jgi:thiosulfate dehydrogenase [quinone] large subunit